MPVEIVPTVTNNKLCQICIGFKPNNEALKYCSNSGCLISGGEIVAHQINSTDYYQSIECIRVVTGKCEQCKFCNKTQHLINQHGKRADKAVLTGSVQGWNCVSSNTLSLLEAQVQCLQQKWYAANHTVTVQKQQLDSIFTDNVKISKSNNQVVKQKMDIFIKLCSALSKTEHVLFFCKLFQNQLNNFLKETPLLHWYMDEVKHFWKYF